MNDFTYPIFLIFIFNGMVRIPYTSTILQTWTFPLIPKQMTCNCIVHCTCCMRRYGSSSFSDTSTASSQSKIVPQYFSTSPYSRVDREIGVFKYGSFEPCWYQDKYFVDQSCQKIGTSICIIKKVKAIF